MIERLPAICLILHSVCPSSVVDEVEKVQAGNRIYLVNFPEIRAFLNLLYFINIPIYLHV
jgi:hypothetical protein